MWCENVLFVMQQSQIVNSSLPATCSYRPWLHINLKEAPAHCHGWESLSADQLYCMKDVAQCGDDPVPQVVLSFL